MIRNSLLSPHINFPSLQTVFSFRVSASILVQNKTNANKKTIKFCNKVNAERVFCPKLSSDSEWKFCDLVENGPEEPHDVVTMLRHDDRFQLNKHFHLLTVADCTWPDTLQPKHHENFNLSSFGYFKSINFHFVMSMSSRVYFHAFLYKAWLKPVNTLKPYHPNHALPSVHRKTHGTTQH